MSVRNETLAELESDRDRRPVWMSATVMRAIVENAGDGTVTISWGEPDADGFYTPTITVRRTPEEWARMPVEPMA